MKKIRSLLSNPDFLKIAKRVCFALFIFYMIYLVMPKWFYTSGNTYKYNAVNGKIYDYGENEYGKKEWREVMKTN